MVRLSRLIAPVAWVVFASAFAASSWLAVLLLQTLAVNRWIAAGSVASPPASAAPGVRYAAGWRAERALRFTDAVQLYTDAQASGDAARDSRAWFALGNVYFKTGVAASREYEEKVGPVFENAQFDLARDAYRSALRLQPDLAGARYNLELLERLAPVRHLQGWRRNTDPIMLVPDKHNGWTSMQDDNKRGLP